jgi:adenine-specific DNA methylase
MGWGFPMARVTCRCGETLDVTPGNPDRLTCLRCGAKIRVRRSSKNQRATGPPGDGFVRFYCPCGRRLKIRIEEESELGKCPDCGRIVPVPESARLATGNTSKHAQDQRQNTRPLSGMRTVEMDAVDLANLDQWARCHQAKASQPEQPQDSLTIDAKRQSRNPTRTGATPLEVSKTLNVEAGLHLCTRCGKPLHFSASVCRCCGEPAPRC